MLLVAIACTANDFLNNRSRLSQSIGNFNSCFGSDVCFLIVHQSKSIDEYTGALVSALFAGSHFKVLPVTYLSVSRARNDALIYAKDNAFDYLIFHDASLIYTKGYLAWVKRSLGNVMLSTRFKFSDDVDVDEGNAESIKTQFRDFSDLFVWSYVFNLKNNIPLFDERFGPGEKSIYVSGEDFLFLRSFFKLNPGSRNFLRYEGVGILHPPRPKDYSKHLMYAEGQGKIHQAFLKEERSLYAIWRCILFFGNAIVRFLFLKKNSLKILFRRLKGFFDTKVKV